LVLGSAGAAIHGGARSQFYWDTPVRAFDWFLEHEDTKSAVAVSQYPVIMAVTRGTVDLHERALLLVPPDSLDAGFIGERMASSLIADRGDVEGAILAGERSLSIGIATEQGPSKPVPDG
jgi:hypothetical protein